MKIALIQSRFEAGNAHFPPIGVLSIATVLKNKGNEVCVIDTSVWSKKEIEKIGRFSPDLTGFSFLTSYCQTTKSAVQSLRKAFPEMLMCGGGIHPTALPEKCLRDMEFDFVVIGEGEETIGEIVERLENGAERQEAYKGVKGVCYLDNGHYVQEPIRPLLDITSLPIPDRSFLEFEKYIRLPGTIKGKPMERSTSIIVSRGCPFDCIFCNNKLMWQSKLRFRKPEQALEEVKYLCETYNLRGIYFADNLLTGNRKWILQLCEGIQSLPYKIWWGCNARVDTITDELAETMKLAGCVQIDFGVESGSETILKKIKKKTYPEKAEEAFNILRRYGIRSGATFIIGTPGETKRQIEKTYRLAKKINPNHVCFNFMTPYPGTTLYEESIEKGWISKDIVFNESWVNRQAVKPMLTVGLSEGDLIGLRNRFNRSFVIRNYFNMPNIKTGFLLLIAALKLPVDLIKILKEGIKTNNPALFIEGLLKIYLKNRKKMELKI